MKHYGNSTRLTAFEY